MDIEFLLALQNFRDATNSLFNSFMSYITTYGEEFMLTLIVCAIYWCANKEQGVFTMMTWGTSKIVNGFLKITFCKYRPWIRDFRIKPVGSAKKTAGGYSFPSGHTANATSVFGSISVNKKITRCLRFLMILMIVFVAFSRNYLGVHTPQDVIVGVASTVLVIFFVSWLLKFIENKPTADIVVLVVGLLINIFVIVYAVNKGYPMDYDAEGQLIVDPASMVVDTYRGCGFSLAVLISWFIDRRWLKYEISGTIIERVTHYAAGIIGYFVVLHILVPLLPHTVLGYVLDRFIRVIYIMLIVPLFIKIFGTKNKSLS